MALEERANSSKCDLTKALVQVMARKKTNLCAALDVTTSAEVLKLADEVGPHVCIIKTHYDSVSDWSSDTEKALKTLASTHDFIILEDRKFADIGNTVKSQIDRVLSWADAVTMFSIGGPGSVQGAVESIKGAKEPKGIFLVAELSSKENLIDRGFTNRTVEHAFLFREQIIGFVAQNRTSFKEPSFLQLTPGVSSAPGGDLLGQNYVSPQDAILKKGGDVIVVGRAITQSQNPKSAAQNLQKILWSAYEERISF